MRPTTKLTKRQKKGIAFRERGHSKFEPSPLAADLEDEIDVLSLEDQVSVVATQNQQGSQVSAEGLVSKGRAGEEGGETETGVVVATRKRKREAGKEAKRTFGSDKPEPKRKRGLDGCHLDNMEQSVDDHAKAEEEGRESEKTKQRFILFLGNLKYTTTTEAIQVHFSTCVPPPTVRLLTPKLSTELPTKSVTKSKGCAFLEFKHRGALQQGLKLHHSELDGRQINVELTAGGGGKGLARMKKLKQRNKELEGQRRKQDSAVDTRSQRFSATSGAEQTHVRLRTWTVGDIRGRETYRGGQGHQRGFKERGSLSKEFRTGVNAIPVG